MLDDELTVLGPGAEQRAEDNPSGPSLDPEALATLPQGLLDRLSGATTAARHDDIVAISESQRATDPRLAEGSTARRSCSTMRGSWSWQHDDEHLCVLADDLHRSSALTVDDASRNMHRFRGSGFSGWTVFDNSRYEGRMMPCASPLPFNGRTSSANTDPAMGNYVRRLLELAVQAGVDLSVSELDWPAAALSSRTELAVRERGLWERLHLALADPSLPLRLAEGLTVEDTGIAGLAILTSTNVRAGLRRLVQFCPLFTTSGGWVLDDDPCEPTMSWRCDLPLDIGVRLANENGLAELVQGVRQATGLDFVPRAVCLRHPATADTSAHAAFFRCPLRWGALEYQVWFPAAWMDTPLRLANPVMCAHFHEHAERAVGQLRARASFTRRVEDLVRELISVPNQPCWGGLPAQVASRLAVSERGLRRHLAAERTSFSRIAQRARVALAETLLGDPSLSLDQVAERLGYADVRSFSRAFQRATGASPARYRASLNSTWGCSRSG